jgi:HK97 gp10 family phage protein
VSVKITGERDFSRAMRRLGVAFNDAVDKGTFVTANEIRTYAIKSIQETSSGRQVQRSRQGGGTYTHTAAAEGQAPNTDTGKLVASLAAERVNDATYHIGSGLDYASWLEFGTSKMGARPWLNPAFRAKKNNLIVNISEVINLYIDRLQK